MGALFLSSGQEVTLGRKLGSGGEGVVYEVAGMHADLVAKVYHHPPDHAKRSKLAHMVRCSSEQLRSVAAWPLDTLADNGRQVRGFVMAKMIGYEPIHKLYSPANRKHTYPHADWNFLVNTARNVAAAFHVIHRNGHIIGDVNQGNVVVARDSRVRLIDCDSFQVLASEGAYLCGVGVGHFTPPEIQGVKSYSEFRRTANHDNFGLAVLCFHILFMGRHPFVGVSAKHDVSTIEKAIESFRFAFSRDPSIRRGVLPPEDSVTLDIVPAQVSAMFESAFSPDGASRERPSALMWAQSMHLLKGSLVSCSTESQHKYYRGLASCPWCGLEKRSGVTFFIGGTASQKLPEAPIEEIWHRTQTVPSPGPVPLIEPSRIKVTPSPLPAAAIAGRTLRLCAIVTVVLLGVLGSIGSESIVPLMVLICMVVGVYAARLFEPAEYKDRRNVLRERKGRWRQMSTEWNDLAGDRRFRAALTDLTSLKAQYDGLPAEYAKQKACLYSEAREHQLNALLRSSIIQSGSIRGIGPTRRAILASCGITTAADIQADRILRIRGFGYSLAADLLFWRDWVTKRFVFDPNEGSLSKAMDALNRTSDRKKAELEEQLRAGPHRLVKARDEAIKSRDSLEGEVLAAARGLAVARADASICW